jgi:Protein of unknown function (DUF4065)
MTDRLAVLIHHITTLCEPERLGRTRLAKILWLSDVEQFRRTGKTITGSDDYLKDEYGPRHRRFYEAIEKLQLSGQIVTRQSLTPLGPRQEIIPLTNPDVRDFAADEIAIVDRITAAIVKLSAKQASDLTHDEVWESARFNERIPVASVAPVIGEMTPDIEDWAVGVFADADRAAS